MAVVQVSLNWILNFLFQFWIEATSTWIFCRCFYRSPQCHPGQQFCPWCLWWGSAWSSRSASCWWSASSAIYVLLEMVITLWPDRDTKTSWGIGVTLQWTGTQYVWQFPDALNHQQQFNLKVTVELELESNIKVCVVRDGKLVEVKSSEVFPIVAFNLEE